MKFAQLPSDADVARATASVMRLCKGFLVDLDGTLIHGAVAIDGARDFLAAYGARTVLVSNNSSDTPATMATQLAALGLDMPASRILLAGAVAIESIAALHPGAATLLLGSPALAVHALASGLKLVKAAAEIVVVARDEHFDYRALSRAANAIARGARFYATNPDLTHPGADGRLVPETGTLTAAIAASAGRAPDLVFGKPGPALFAAGLKRLGTLGPETVVIGDNPATDGAGARSLGLCYVEVGPQAGRTIADLLD